MNKQKLMASASRGFHKAIFKIKNRSPEILMVSGVVGLVTAGVWACKRTEKAKEVYKDNMEHLDQIEKIKDTYDVEYYEADRYNAKKRLIVGVAKEYGPPVMLATGSIMLIFMSNNIMRKRNLALAAAYTAVDQGFREYRGRVQDRFGQAIEREIYHDIKYDTATEPVADPETGEIVGEDVMPVAKSGNNKHVFDAMSPYWKNNPSYNISFIRSRERQAQETLARKGYLYKNEVLESLGLPQTKEGQRDGWIYDDKTIVDFGLNWDPINQDTLTSVGWQKDLFLDFNTTGDIWSRLTNQDYMRRW